MNLMVFLKRKIFCKLIIILTKKIFILYRKENERYLSFENPNFMNDDIAEAGFYDSQNDNDIYVNKLGLYLAA